jgi:hypothetical protein
VPLNQFVLIISGGKAMSSSAAIGGNGSQVTRGPWQIDLLGAAILSGGSGTFDVQIALLSLLTSSSMKHFLLPR